MSRYIIVNDEFDDMTSLEVYGFCDELEDAIASCDPGEIVIKLDKVYTGK